ncbi:MAG: rhodanese-like domain-containing protein [Tepidisphaeraceae bacterium]
MTLPTRSPAQVQQSIAAGEAPLLIDVRTPAEYAAVHAANARLMPLDQLDPQLLQQLRQSEHQPIYLLCHSGARASKACDALLQAGLTDVTVVEGGTAAWERAGLPVVRGTRKTISLERQVRIAAGSLVAIGTLLAWAVHPVFLIVPAFVGCGLVFAGVTDFCGMGILLGKMPWNRAPAAGPS